VATGDAPEGPREETAARGTAGDLAAECGDPGDGGTAQHVTRQHVTKQHVTRQHVTRRDVTRQDATTPGNAAPGMRISHVIRLSLLY
jgi:hypothetical protein